MTSLLALTLLLAPAAEAPSPAQTPAVERARVAYEEERYEDAIAALEEAYLEDPRPAYVYAKAQAQRLAGRCTEAVKTYRAFIELDPPEQDVEDANAGMRACRDTLDEGGDPTEAAVAVPPPAPVQPQLSTSNPETLPRHVDRPRTRWWADPAGHALTWPGLVVATVGSGLLIEAHRLERFAAGSEDESAYRDRLGPAPVISRVGIPMIAVGAAALLGGVIRFAVVARRRERGRTTARRAP